MGIHKCMICDDKVACRAIDEELEKGMTGAALARLMTLRGFKVSDQTVLEHNKHRQPIAPPGVAKTRRDLATMVRDKVLDAVEGEKLDVLDPEAQPALKTGLQAESLLDKRAARNDGQKAAIQIAVLLAGGPNGLYAPPELTDGTEDDDNIYDGEAVEVG